MAIQLYDALEEMFADVGTNASIVSKELYSSAVIQSSKSRGSVMNAGAVAKIAEHCGYELCLVPEQSVPRNAIPISPDQSKPKKDDGVRLGEGSEPSESNEEMIG